MSAPKSPTTPVNVLALVQGTFAGDSAAEKQLIRQVLLPILDAAVSKYLFGNAKRLFDKKDIIQEVRHRQVNAFKSSEKTSPRSSTAQGKIPKSLNRTRAMLDERYNELCRKRRMRVAIRFSPAEDQKQTRMTLNCDLRGFGVR